jgi:hypothetical protein
VVTGSSKALLDVFFVWYFIIVNSINSLGCPVAGIECSVYKADIDIDALAMIVYTSEA